MRLGVLEIDAVVADVRSAHDDHLPGVGGICEYLFVACHGGIENHLRCFFAGPAETPAGMEGAVFEQENRFFKRHPQRRNDLSRIIVSSLDLPIERMETFDPQSFSRCRTYLFALSGSLSNLVIPRVFSFQPGK